MLSAGPPPLHVVPPVAGHGVTVFAEQVARAVRAPVVDLDTAMRAPRRAVHVHVTDTLFGTDAVEAAGRLAELGRRHPMTVTLHDVPQPGEGRWFDRRAGAYRTMADAAVAWAVSSHHERDLVDRHVRPLRSGVVVPLPVMPLASTAGLARSATGGPPVVGLLGWVYPGKGHAQVIAACGRLGVPLTVRALGRPARGHDDLVAELEATATAAGVGFECTGWVADVDLSDALDAVTVPVSAHRAVSASGSVNSWLAAGRRPVVVDGPYVDEMDRLRPGTLCRVSLPDLGPAIGRALAEPATTRFAAGVDLRPDLEDVAASYLDWWRSLS